MYVIVHSTQALASVQINVVVHFLSHSELICLEKNFVGNFYHHFKGIHALASKLVFLGHTCDNS